MNAEDERLRGESAKHLLANPLFKDAFALTERQILDQMKQVRPSDERMHTRLIDAYKLLHVIRAHIEQHVETGMLAELQLAGEGKIKRMFRR